MCTLDSQTNYPKGAAANLNRYSSHCRCVRINICILTTGDAHAAFKADQNQLMCFSGLPHVSSEDISSKVHTCDYTAAAHATFTGRRGLFDAYTGEIICGRALTVLEFDSLDSSPYSTIGEFSTLISIAIQKVQALPDLGS